MCGRFALFSPARTLADRFGVEGPPPLEPRYNIGPGRKITVLGLNAEGARRMSALAWGLTSPQGGLMINARSETLAAKPSFRESFAARRCLVPADLFYEWRKDARPKSSEPYKVLAQGGAPFAMAALWRMEEKDGSRAARCIIVTTRANEALEEIHPRMPVILRESFWESWLAHTRLPPSVAQSVFEPLPPDLTQALPVNLRVNKIAHEGADLLLPPACM